MLTIRLKKANHSRENSVKYQSDRLINPWTFQFDCKNKQSIRVHYVQSVSDREINHLFACVWLFRYIYHWMTTVPVNMSYESYLTCVVKYLIVSIYHANYISDHVTNTTCSEWIRCYRLACRGSSTIYFPIWQNNVRDCGICKPL